MRSLGPVELDRAVGSLVGLAAGDALGAGYEFGPAPTSAPEMIGGGLGSWEVGEWTDDTQMAICVAEVASTGTLDVEVVGDRFVTWLRSDPSDVGIQTRAVLGGATGGTQLAARATDHFRENPGSAAGNGSLMRTAPVALAHLGDDEAIATAAMEVSLLTHGDPLAGQACVLWCIGIDRAIREGRLDGAHDGLELLPAPARQPWATRLAAAEADPPGSFRPNGFVVTALQAAYAAVRQTPVPSATPCTHLQRALEQAVQIGDDTDTVAAIAGQLLGARWGASAVPLQWQALLHGWPGYRVDDLTSLAVLAARNGAPDGNGWPMADHLVPYYRDHFAARGTSVALADDDGVRIGDAATSTEPEPGEVVVSLCRMGRRDVPAGVEHHQVWLVDDADPESNPNVAFLLGDLARAITTWRQQGRPVLVHCVRAESRTPTVAAAYLCERFGLSAATALDRVRRVLPAANPNPSFRSALEQLWPGGRQ